MPAPTPKNDQLRAMREAKAFQHSAMHQRQSQPAEPVTLAPVAEKIAKAKAAVDNVNKAVNKNADHQAKWRAANPELARERTKIAMRKSRSKSKD